MMYYPGYEQSSPRVFTNFYVIVSYVVSSCCAVCALLLTAITSGVTPRIISAV